MKTVKQILIERDNMSPEDADDLINDFKIDLDELLLNDNPLLYQAEDLVYEYFGLEPDYLMEFLN